MSGNPYGPRTLLRTNTWSAWIPFDPWMVMNRMSRPGFLRSVTVYDCSPRQGFHTNPEFSRATMS